MTCEWPGFSNVEVRTRDYTRGKTYELTELREYEFMCGFLRSLRDQLGDRFVQSRFLLYWKIDQRGFLDDVSQIQPVVDKQKVIFLLGDETGTAPSELASRVGLIFKVHLQQPAAGNVLYFPLDCPNSHSYDPSVIEADGRTTSVFFSGALNNKAYWYVPWVDRQFILSGLSTIGLQEILTGKSQPGRAAVSTVVYGEFRRRIESRGVLETSTSIENRLVPRWFRQSRNISPL